MRSDSQEIKIVWILSGSGLWCQFWCTGQKCHE